jgi:hypothetical protein
MTGDKNPTGSNNDIAILNTLRFVGIFSPSRMCPGIIFFKFVVKQKQSIVLSHSTPRTRCTSVSPPTSVIAFLDNRFDGILDNTSAELLIKSRKWNPVLIVFLFPAVIQD